MYKAKLSLIGFFCSFALTGQAEEISKSDILELTRNWYHHLDKTPLGLKGYIRVQTHEGYTLVTGEPTMGSDDFLKLPFQYFQDGKGAVYEKFSMLDSLLHDKNRTINEIQLWKSEKGFVHKKNNRSYYTISISDPRPSPLEFITIGLSFMPRDAFTLDYGGLKYIDMISDGLENDVVWSNMSISEGKVIIEWSEHWGESVPAWKGYYNKEKFVFNLSKQGVLEKRVSEFISKDAKSGPDLANSTITECSDYRNINGVWLPFKTRHEIVYSENEELQEHEPKLPLQTVPGISFELIVEEAVDVAGEEIFELNLKPGMNIYDEFKGRFFIYGHSPEDMLKILSNEKTN